MNQIPFTDSIYRNIELLEERNKKLLRMVWIELRHASPSDSCRVNDSRLKQQPALVRRTSDYVL